MLLCFTFDSSVINLIYSKQLLFQYTMFVGEVRSLPIEEHPKAPDLLKKH